MLIVGLGNPGKQYEETRHNLGYMFVDKIAEAFNVKFKIKHRFNAYVAEFKYNNQIHYLLKPTTYMNLSGNAVKPFMNLRKISLDDLVVVSDDLDLPVGKIRIRKKSSAGGHNGIKSIINACGSDEFKRIRIGIDKTLAEDTIDFVLSKFSDEEKEDLNKALDQASDIAKDLLDYGFDYIMNKYN